MSTERAPSVAEKPSGTWLSYTAGFVLSLVLTIDPYIIVVHHLLRGWGLTAALAVFAVLQLCVQLFFFLHLGHEAKPRWNLLALLFALLVVFIVGFGSLWIMHNLQYNMMPPNDVNQYMSHHDDIL